MVTKIKPIASCVLPDTQPMALTEAQIERNVKAFQHAGWSAHSGLGATMWCIVNWCRETKTPYVVWKHTNGYGVQQLGRSVTPILEGLGFRKVEGF